MRDGLYWPTPLGEDTLTMLHGRVAVHVPEQQPEELRTDRYEHLGPMMAGALVAPHTASGPGHYRRGIVRAVGLGAILETGARDTSPLSVGDVVLIGKHVHGEEFSMPDGETVWVILEDDVVAKLVPFQNGLNPPVDAARTWELEPLADRVLLDYHREPPPSEGVIEAPETYYAAVTGTVLAVGPGWKNAKGVYLPMESRPGQLVYFPGDTGQVVNLAGYAYFMVREDEILAVKHIPAVRGISAFGPVLMGRDHQDGEIVHDGQGYWRASCQRVFINKDEGFRTETTWAGPFFDAVCKVRVPLRKAG